MENLQLLPRALPAVPPNGVEAIVKKKKKKKKSTSFSLQLNDMTMTMVSMCNEAEAIPRSNSHIKCA